MGACSLFRFLVKYSLFTVNLILTLAGLAIAVAGIVVYIKMKDILEIKDINLEKQLQWVAIAVIVLGAIIFFIALSGCWGAAAENKCLLSTYAVILVLLVAPKIFLAVKYDAYNSLLQTNVQKSLTASFEHDSVPLKVAEIGLHCCGTNGPDSYAIKSLLSPTSKFVSNKVPKSCCEQKLTSLEDFATLVKKYTEMFNKMNRLKNSTIDINNINNYNTMNDFTCDLNDAAPKGCLNEAQDFIDYYMKIIKVVVLGFIAVEILEFFMAVYLCASKRRGRSEKGYY